MRALILAGAAALALTACDLTTGGFKNPADMTLAEKCTTAQLALAAAKVNKVDEDLVAKLEANIALFCPVP